MKDLESQLRAALRPAAPREAFTKTLLAQISLTRQPRTTLRRTAWLTASLAATLLLAVGARQHVQDLRNRESGLEARRQVIEALRMTSQKLDLAYEAVKNQSASETPGA